MYIICIYEIMPYQLLKLKSTDTLTVYKQHMHICKKEKKYKSSTKIFIRNSRFTNSMRGMSPSWRNNSQWLYHDLRLLNRTTQPRGVFLHIELKKTNPLYGQRRAQLGLVEVLSRARGRSPQDLACENNYNKWLFSNGYYISVCWFLQYFFQSQVRSLF